MAANGISTLATKQERQIAKLEYAQAKRKGRVITDGGESGTYGTWSDDGTDDDTKNYYRPNNTYDATSLPDTYNGNVPGADDNPNTGGLLPKRPWVSVGTIAAPESIGESVDGGTLVDLQIWYDAGDVSTFIPGAADEQGFTQWSDKSSYAHNANPVGGATTRPTYESTILKNIYGYVEFDGVNDALSVNPSPWLQSQTAMSIFIVAKNLDTLNNPGTLISTDTGDLLLEITGSSIQFGVQEEYGSSNSGDNDWHLYTVLFDGSQTGNANRLKLRIDKSAETLDFTGSTIPAATDAASTTLYIGSNGTTNYFEGYIGEVVVFTKALTATEYGNVENYLYNKWDLGIA